MADGTGAPITATGPRALPSVQSLLDHPNAATAGMSRATLTAALRTELARLRTALLSGAIQTAPNPASILAAATARATSQSATPRPATSQSLRRVINATGIVIHTNLGRAPLAAEAIAAIAKAASSACNLEYDLETGRRGPRAPSLQPLLHQLTGAQAALAVNNNAAAMLLALTTLAADAEIIVSRGELVEIGGGFRIPDIIAQGGARLVEVGTTNKTRIADYEAAITPRTKILLKVHQSNFRIVGFTAEATLQDLATLARQNNLLLLNDLGSGTLAPLPGNLAPLEPTVRQSLQAGSDLVAFSADKLLGGPQAGILAGHATLIEQMRRHPLQRALRLDKLTLAALEATLTLHTDPEHALRIPILRTLSQTPAQLQARAENLCTLLQQTTACQTQIHPSTAHAGGGALPGQAIPSLAVSIHLPGRSPDNLARALRSHHPAIVGRIHDGRFLLDMLTVQDTEITEIAQALGSASF